MRSAMHSSCTVRGIGNIVTSSHRYVAIYITTLGCHVGGIPKAVFASVRVLVTLRLLREFEWSRGRWRGVSRGGALINNWNKLSVYTRRTVVCAHECSDLKRKARLTALQIVSQFKIESLSISCSHVNPIEFLIGLPKLDKTYLFTELFLFLQFCNVRNFNNY